MGRLIEADKLKEVFRRNVVGGNAYFDLIDNAPTVEAIPKADYEARLKADLRAILIELQLEIEENVLADEPSTLLPFLQARETYVAIIQQKINSLKESENE